MHEAPQKPPREHIAADVADFDPARMQLDFTDEPYDLEDERWLVTGYTYETKIEGHCYNFEITHSRVLSKEGHLLEKVVKIDFDTGKGMHLTHVGLPAIFAAKVLMKDLLLFLYRKHQGFDYIHVEATKLVTGVEDATVAGVLERLQRLDAEFSPEKARYINENIPEALSISVIEITPDKLLVIEYTNGTVERFTLAQFRQKIEDARLRDDDLLIQELFVLLELILVDTRKEAQRLKLYQRQLQSMGFVRCDGGPAIDEMVNTTHAVIFMCPAEAFLQSV